VADARGVTHAMAVAVDGTGTPGELVAIDSAQAADVVRLRADETPLPPARLFAAITPSGAARPGASLSAPRPGAGAGAIPLTVTLGSAAATATPGKATATPASQPASGAGGLAAELGPVVMTLTILDRTGAAFQVEDGSLVPDGQPHVIAVPLGGDKALYPLRVASITLSFGMPLASVPTLALTLRGLSLAGWTQQASTPDPINFPPGKVGEPSDGKSIITAEAATFTFGAGYAPPVSVGAGGTGSIQHFAAQLLLLPHEPRVPSIPAIATRAFMNANSQQIGSVVPESVDGATVPLRIVAEVVSFPTVTTSGGALIADLGSLQAYLARQTLPPLPVNQWWLATAGGGVPPALTASVPVGTDITSAAGLTTANTGDPLSAAPQLALLAMAAAASLLAIMGFWVSIAADVRERRAGAALLAALGITRRSAALHLCLEKLLLSLPSAAFGVLLGTLVARLLVPAVTLSPTAQRPTPPALTLYDLPQAIALALVVAIVPVVIAALAATRRPDPAADLRAAEAA
jgi:hypothetical protein